MPNIRYTLFLILVLIVGFPGHASDAPIDSSKQLANMYVQFDLKIITPPDDPKAKWLFKLESFQQVEKVELSLDNDITHGEPPLVGEWRTYRFDLLSVSQRFTGIDLEAIDKVLIFPTWGAGKGASYRVDNVFFAISDGQEKHIIFDGSENPTWPAWDCCGGSTPVIVDDEDPEKGMVVQFEVANENRGTVLGFGTHVAATSQPFDVEMLLRQDPIKVVNDNTWVKEDSTNPIHFNLLASEDINAIGAIYSILKDEKGFMWFGGSDGLARYDGYNLKIYKHDNTDSSSISSNQVWDLLIDSQGRFWIATDLGLNLFDYATQTFKHFLHDPNDDTSISHNIVKILFEDSENVVWVGTYDGLNSLNGEQLNFTRYFSNPNDPDSLSDNIVSSITEDHDGVIWLATDRGLNKYDRNTKKFKAYFNHWGDQNTLDNDRVRIVREDSLNRLWAGTYTSLNLFDRDTEKVTRFKFENYDSLDISDIAYDQHDRLWIVSGNGLLRFDPDKLTFSIYRNNPLNKSGFQGKFPSTLFKDDSQNWWFGTFPNGINYVDQSKNFFTTYQHELDKKSLTDNSVLSITEDSAGNLWLGTDGGGLNYFDRKSASFTELVPNEQSDEKPLEKGVLSATFDAENNLWIGLWEEPMKVFDTETNTFIHQTPERGGIKTPDTLIAWTSYKDSNGNMWFGTINEGLIKYDKNQNKFLYYKPIEGVPDSFSSLFVWAIYEDSSGQMWFGTNDGLEKYNSENETFQHFRFDKENPDSLSNNFVLSVAEDLNGTLWVGTRGGGLNKFDSATERFTHYGNKSGLPDETVTAILVDSDNFLWLSTYNGLCRFDSTNNQCFNFVDIGGLKTNKFNIGSALKLRTGELAFGGTGGFTVFDPATVKASDKIPPIVLTDFQLANRSISVSDADSVLTKDISVTSSISLNHQQSMFSIEFSALDYQHPEKNQYAYLLDGYDTQWNEIGTRRRATYTNLDPGNYTFRVKGSNSEGLWNQQGASVAITVLPPPWRSWWAYSLYALAAIVLLSLITYLQMKKMQERKLLKLALWASRDELWNIDLIKPKVVTLNALEYLLRSKEESWLLSGLDHSYIHPDDQPAVDDVIKNQINAGQQQFEVSYRAKTKQGTWVWLLDRGEVTSRNHKGEPTRLSGTTKNIDKLKTAEADLLSLNHELEIRVEQRTDELKQSNEFLRNTQDQLIESEKMAALGTVVVGVSHELNTPIGISVTALSSLEDHLNHLLERFESDTLSKSGFRKFAEDANSSISLAYSNMKRSASIIQSFKKISVVRENCQLSTNLLREIIEKSVSESEEKSKNHLINIVDINCNPDIRITSYSDTLMSVFEQLLINAQQHAFSPDEPVKISISVTEQDDTFTIQFQDQGKGMSTEELAKLFEPFFTTNRGKYIGLGMFVVFNEVNHLLQGSIEGKSTLGQGTVITVVLPKVIQDTFKRLRSG